jgi:hypothetical protein
VRLVDWVLTGAAAISLAAPADAAAPGRWNPRAPENNELLPAFSHATVEPVLNAIPVRHQKTMQAGKPGFLLTFPNGRKAILTMSSCDPAGTACKALGIVSYWTRIANAPPERTARAIGQFNQRYSFAKAFIAPDGRPALQRYLTADYGFVRGNLAVNLLVFSSQADLFAAETLRALESGAR